MPPLSTSPPSITPLRTRFAPSPSGRIHLGNARTALLSYLAARHSGGQFVLRIEDTDDARSDEGHVRSLLEDLRWLGLQWDEGPEVGGPHAPYRQSERRAVYAEALAKLQQAGLTYPCFCTPAELSLERKQQLAAKQPPRYGGKCRALSHEQRQQRLAQGLHPAIRFQVPAGQVVSFTDTVHGEQRFATDDIGDFVIVRADGSAAFFFSNAIDDALMQISLVLRGDDHLTNTPRQLLILQALALPAPAYAHVALLLGMDGSPLSKRHGATSLQEFRERGFLPEALRNHIVRLGHATTRDGWLDEAAMIEDFDLTRLGRAAAKFDEVQLRHWQREAVVRLPLEHLRQWLPPLVPEGIEESVAQAFYEAVRPNVELPTDAVHWAQVVFGEIPVRSREAEKAIREAGTGFFAAAVAAVEQTGTDLKSLTRAVSEATQRKGPALFMPLRAALTGETHGPELGPLLRLLTPQLTKTRLIAAAAVCSANPN